MSKPDSYPTTSHLWRERDEWGKHYADYERRCVEARVQYQQRRKKAEELARWQEETSAPEKNWDEEFREESDRRDKELTELREQGFKSGVVVRAEQPDRLEDAIP